MINDVGNVEDGVSIKYKIITDTVYWSKDNNSIRWYGVTQNMLLLTKIILDETQTVDIPINQICFAMLAARY